MGDFLTLRDGESIRKTPDRGHDRGVMMIDKKGDQRSIYQIGMVMAESSTESVLDAAALS